MGYLTSEYEGSRSFVQSPSGETDYLEVDRGNWVSGTTYYPGDKVKYAGDIYKCIAQNNTTPLNAYYWKLLVTKGEDGADGADGTSGMDGKDGKDGVEGQGYLYAYYPSDSLTPPSRPPAPGAISSGWIASPDFSGKRYLYVSQCIRTAGAWGAWSSPKIYSVMPGPGDPGPAIVFRDVIRYSDGLYYVFK